MNVKKRPDGDLSEPMVDGIPVRTSLGEFAENEMLECASCKRKTPPNRLDCIYCGAALVVDEGQKALLRPVIRPPAEDADASHLIYYSNVEAVNTEQLTLLEKMTRLSESDVRELTGAGSAVPLARGESGKAIELAAERIRESGLDVQLISESEVKTNGPSLRLRSLATDGEDRVAFVLFNNDEVVRASAEDVELIVVGISLENKIEASEKHKRKGLEKVLHTTEITEDETLIDVYVRSQPSAFRIQATGFDFAYLGERKALTAPENLKQTIRFLREFAPGAVFDDSYTSIRSSLDQIWPVTEKQDTKSIKRTGFGKYEKTRVTTSTNLEQFSRYSQLQRRALRRSLNNPTAQ